jgi:hypothetical protein
MHRCEVCPSTELRKDRNIAMTSPLLPRPLRPNGASRQLRLPKRFAAALAAVSIFATPQPGSAQIARGPGSPASLTEAEIGYDDGAVAALLGCGVASGGLCLFPGPTARAVVAHQGSELSLVPGLSLNAAATSDGTYRDGLGERGFVVGARLRSFGIGPISSSVSGGVYRDLGTSAFWSRFETTAEFGDLRLATIVQGEHVFSSGRDALDVAVLASVSYAVARPLRLGVDCLTQDLEGVAGNDAEGGSSELCGPIAAFDLNHRLSLGVGSTTSLAQAGTSKTFGRASFAYTF